jgi:cellulose synthase/poly-beta-1,6-N-acetylglucosamine synthase-like glycosyltransferase
LRTAVLIPVRGFPRFLEETLDAVLAQDPDEVVVVDDGSFEPIRSGRVRVVRRNAPGGPAGARATGLDALGAVDVVALCDADDTWEPGSLAALVAGLQAEPRAAAAFGRALVVGADGRPTGERWYEPAAGLHEPAAFYAHNPIPTSCSALRRSALDEAGGFGAPDLVAEDWDLWLRLHGPLLCVPQARVRYRRHPEGLTADVERLARAQLALHERHARLVDDAAARSARRSDRRALRRARARRALSA